VRHFELHGDTKEETAMKRLIGLIAVGALVAAPALAIHPGTELFVSAASRGPGVGTSVWVTDLYLYNPNNTAANVTIYWLVRGQANTSPISTALTVGAGQTAVLEDIIKSRFGLDTGNGAFRLTSDVPVMANAAIINKAGGTEFGQGFEAIPVGASIPAGSTTDVVALKSNADYRTNYIIMDTSGSGSQATASVVDPSGVELAHKTYTLGAYEPVLESMTSFGAPAFQDGTLVVSVTSGAVITAASRINQNSGDPLTLSASWPLQTGGGATLATAGTYYGTAQASDQSLGGVILTVIDTGGAADATDTRAVTSIDFEYPDSTPGCNFFFGAGGSFNTPVPLSQFFNGGVTFTNDYGTGYGSVDWTVTLTEVAPNLHFSGTISGSGTGWTSPNDGCNSDQGSDDVNVGKQE
jgi:Family of unknown function (DUF5719)